MGSLLIGWKQIYEKLFHDDNGKRYISYQTLVKKHGPGLKASGAVFKWKTGKSRMNVIAGWTSVIQNYFIKLGQQEDAARRKAKQAKNTVSLGDNKLMSGDDKD